MMNSLMTIKFSKEWAEPKSCPQESVWKKALQDLADLLETGQETPQETRKLSFSKEEIQQLLDKHKVIY